MSRRDRVLDLWVRAYWVLTVTPALVHMAPDNLEDPTIARAMVTCTFTPNIEADATVVAEIAILVPALVPALVPVLVEGARTMKSILSR